MQSPTSSINRLKNSLTTFYVKSTASSPVKEDQNIIKSVLRMQQKEIDRLEHQNKNLQLLTEHQCGLLYQERTIRTRSMRQSIMELPPPRENKQQRRSTIKTVLQAMKPPIRRSSVINKINIINNECFKLNAALEAKEEEAKRLYKEDSSIQLIREVLRDEDSFIDIISTYAPQQVSIIYDKLKKVFSEHHQMFELLLKFRDLIENQFNLNQLKLQQEALNQLALQSKQVMECKNAQIIIHDFERKSYIQHVYQSKELLHLKNAKYDQRFKEDDFNQMLAAPILDNQRCLGVVVCQDKQSSFTEEDEILIKYLAKQATQIITHSMSIDRMEISLQKFRHALKSLLVLIQQNNKTEFIKMAELRLCELMNSQKSIIRITNDISGIMGLAMQSNSIIRVNNSYNHELFQPDIDINTQLPMLAVPIKYNNKPIGCAEFTQTYKLSQMDQEV